MKTPNKIHVLLGFLNGAPNTTYVEIGNDRQGPTS